MARSRRLCHTGEPTATASASAIPTSTPNASAILTSNATTTTTPKPKASIAVPATILVSAVLLFSPTRARAGAAGIDWQRRVVTAAGRAAPDLNAPSIAVARLGAEKAAFRDAQRNALAALEDAPLSSGSTAGSLLRSDASLLDRVQQKLRGAKATRTHYFSDGGVALEIEVPLDQLPPALAQKLKPPAGAPPQTAPPVNGKVK